VLNCHRFHVRPCRRRMPSSCVNSCNDQDAICLCFVSRDR
jgi:hypothetical protein